MLWPPALAGLANPSTLSDKIIVAAFEFGGNFILYGGMGLLIGLCVQGKTQPRRFGRTVRVTAAEPGGDPGPIRGAFRPDSAADLDRAVWQIWHG